MIREFPNYDDSLQVGARIEQWRRAQSAYDEMQRLVLAEKGAEALSLWAQIRNHFPEFPDERGLVQKAQETAKQWQERERLNNLFAKMGVLARERRWQDVLERWQMIMDADPYYPDSQHLAEEAQAAVAEHEAQAERAAKRQRLNQHYAAMEQLVAQKEWKKAAERWQLIRQLDQSFPDTKKLVPLVKYGLEELQAREEAARKQALLDNRYKQMATQAQAEQWTEAHGTWQKILTLDPTYPDRDNLVPTIVAHVGTGAFERPQFERAEVKEEKGSGCIGRLAKVGVIGIVGLGLLGGGGVLAIILLVLLLPSPDPTTTVPVFFPNDTSTSTVQDVVPQASCPFDPDGFAVIPGVEHGVFQDAQGFVYSLLYDGSALWVTDGVNTVSFSANLTPNQWTTLVDTPFRVCAEPSNGVYYAAFDPSW